MRKDVYKLDLLKVLPLAVVCLGVQPASAGLTVTSGNDKVDLTVYGQVNRALLFADDGHDKHVYHVDNSNIPSRLGFRATADLNPDVHVGARIEVSLQSNGSHQVWQWLHNVADAESHFRPDVRHTDFWVTHDRWGKLSIGKGDTASFGSMQSSFAGVGAVLYPNISDFAGSFAFREADSIFNGNPFAFAYMDDGCPPNPPRTAHVQAHFNALDGFGRTDRVRYDSPFFYGFRLSASVSSDERRDAALRYQSDWGGVVDAQAVVAHAQNRRWGTGSGSFALIHRQSGFNFAVASARRNFSSKHPSAVGAGPQDRVPLPVNVLAGNSGGGAVFAPGFPLSTFLPGDTGNAGLPVNVILDPIPNGNPLIPVNGAGVNFGWLNGGVHPGPYGNTTNTTANAYNYAGTWGSGNNVQMTQNITDRTHKHKVVYLQAGWRHYTSACGTTSLAVDYFKADNAQRDNDEAHAWGAAIVQDFDKVGAQLFAAWRTLNLHTETTTYDKLHMAMVGARIKF